MPKHTGITHKPVVCLACTKLHFINRSTGKLLGETGMVFRASP